MNEGDGHLRRVIGIGDGGNIPVCAEVLAENRVVGFAHFAVLENCYEFRNVMVMFGSVTYHKLEVLGEGEPHDGQHTFEGKLGIIDPTRDEQGAWKDEFWYSTQQKYLVGQGIASTPG